MQTTVAITQYVWLSFGKSNLLGTFIIVNIFLSISSFYFFRCHCRGGPVLLWQWLYFLTFSISSSQIVAKSSQFTNFVCTKCLTAVTRENNNMFGNWMRNLVLKVNRLGCIAGTCPASAELVHGPRCQLQSSKSANWGLTSSPSPWPGFHDYNFPSA